MPYAFGVMTYQVCDLDKKRTKLSLRSFFGGEGEILGTRSRIVEMCAKHSFASFLLALCFPQIKTSIQDVFIIVTLTPINRRGESPNPSTPKRKKL